MYIYTHKALNLFCLLQQLKYNYVVLKELLVKIQKEVLVNSQG